MQLKLEFYPEIWKDVIGFEGRYKISSNGQVLALNPYRNYTNQKILAPQKHYKTGYFQIHLANKKIKKFVSLHRLLAIHFIPNPENLPQVNHLDGNKLNNALWNLEWCTVSRNIKHSYKINLRKRPIGKNPKAIIMLLNGVKVKEFNSIHQASQYVKGNHCTLTRRCVAGKPFKNYMWQFK